MLVKVSIMFCWICSFALLLFSSSNRSLFDNIARDVSRAALVVSEQGDGTEVKIVQRFFRALI